MTEIEEKPLAIAARNANLDPGGVVSILSDPRFEDSKSRYDWRNYIWESTLRRKWGELGLESRIALFVAATEMADHECLLSE